MNIYKLLVNFLKAVWSTAVFFVFFLLTFYSIYTMYCTFNYNIQTPHPVKPFFISITGCSCLSHLCAEGILIYLKGYSGNIV